MLINLVDPKKELMPAVSDKCSLVSNQLECPNVTGNLKLLGFRSRSMKKKIKKNRIDHLL